MRSPRRGERRRNPRAGYDFLQNIPPPVKSPSVFYAPRMPEHAYTVREAADVAHDPSKQRSHGKIVRTWRGRNLAGARAPGQAYGYNER